MAIEKRQSIFTTLGVALLASGVAPTAVAQNTGAVVGGSGVILPCSPLDCSEVDIAPFVVPSGWGMVPDKRPLAVIHTWSGFYNDNPLGIEPKWYDNDVTDPNGTPTDVLDADGDPIEGGNGIPDAFDYLLRALNRKYDDGIRRMVLMLPAGNIQGQTMSSSQWWTMPAWKRAGMTTYVKAWLDSKSAEGNPVSFGIYAGFKIKDPCNLSMSSATVPDPYSLSSMCTFYQNVKPWIDVGAAEYWLDASSPHPETLRLIQKSPDYRDIIRFGGEAIPHDNAGSACDGNRTPDPVAVSNSPFAATFRIVKSRFRNNPVVDPVTTDLGLFLTNHTACTSPNLWTFEEVKSYYDNGWSVYLHGDWVSDRRQPDPADSGTLYFFDYDMNMPLEAIRRLYNFGHLESMLDYDCDGLNEVAAPADEDFALFYSAWLANTGGPGKYLEGDANGNGTIDIYDLLDYMAAQEAWNSSSTVQGVDLGPAWWE